MDVVPDIFFSLLFTFVLFFIIFIFAPIMWALLRLVAEVIVTVINGKKKFVVADYFKENTSDRTAVKIRFINRQFILWFLNKIEKVWGAIPLRHQDLRRPATDSEIIADLGGEKKAEVKLCDIWAMMKAQPNGEAGELCTDYRANIFYVGGTDGTLHAMFVSWCEGSWFIYASSIGFHRWAVGHRVFSY